MRLTGLGKLTLTLVVLVLLWAFLQSDPTLLSRLASAFRMPSGSQQDTPVRPERTAPPRERPRPESSDDKPRAETPAPPARTPRAPDAPSDDARTRGIEQYRRGEYAAAIASFNRATTAYPFDIESITLRENAYALLSGRPTWTIAVAGPFSGASQQYGQQLLFGVHFAQRQINQLGGLGGRRVVVRYYDDAASAEQAVSIAQAITADADVLAVIGHYNSRATIAAGPIYEAAGVVAVTPSSTNPRVRTLGRFIFRVVGDDNAQGVVLANAARGLGARLAAVFFDREDAYSRGLADGFRRRFTSLGGAVIDNPYTTGGTVALGNDARNAELYVVTGEYGDAGRIAKLIRESGSRAPILGGDAVYSQGLFGAGGDAASGILATAFFHYTVRNAPLLPRAEAFSQAFEQALGAPANQNMATAYDAARLVLAAIGEGRTTRAGIQTYLAQIGRGSPAVIGVTGRIAFDVDGEAVGKPWVIVRARPQGDFVADRVVAP
jgi:branched-chain amino acid transport system substrate-binding protein